MKIYNWKNWENKKIIKSKHPLFYLHGSFDEEEVEGFPKAILIGGRLWPLIDGEFKGYIFLKSGVNDVKVSWGIDKELHLIVEYLNSPRNKRFIQPVYIICKNSDGFFLAPEGVENTVDVAIKKLQFNIRLMQLFFAESLYENNFEKKTFEVAENNVGEPSFLFLNSDLDIRETLDMTPDQLYQYFYEEISRKFGEAPVCKYLCFMSCTRYYPPVDEDLFSIEKIMSYARGHAALGGGRMALFGTGSLHTWASSLDDLESCFKDERKIDRLKLFDDSCGRGSYWANYSTTLGATIHELGHCFDLAHTKHGIMARGHDDMNFFYTVGKEKHHDNRIENRSVNIINDDDNGKYKGAHWYRSSAVILNNHKWFNPSIEVGSDPILPKITNNPNVLGFFGSSKSIGSDFRIFDSRTWLSENRLDRLVGIIFHYNEFLESIQFEGIRKREVKEEGFNHADVHQSEVFGIASTNSKRNVLSLADNEYIEQLNIRCGTWIDAIQITTNFKSTPWLGGNGGDAYKIIFSKNENIVSWIGSSHQYVGSLAFCLQRDLNNPTIIPSQAERSNKYPLSLIEVYNPVHGEVIWFREFSSQIEDCTDIWTMTRDIDHANIDGTVWDNKGNYGRFSFSKLMLKSFLTSEN